MWGNVDLLNIYSFLQMDANTFETNPATGPTSSGSNEPEQNPTSALDIAATTAHTPTQVTFRKCNKEPSCVWEHFGRGVI